MLKFILVLILSTVNVFTFAQQENAASSASTEVIQIKLRISGVAFNIQFLPGKDSADAMSKKICTENAEAIGVTADTFGTCVASVGQYIVTNVNSYIQERTISVPITVSGTTLDVRFRPDQVSTDTMADKVCSEEKIQAPFLAENKNLVTSCVEPVSNYLRIAVDNWITDKTLSIPLTVNGTRFDIQYFPERDSSSKVATKLCTEKADVIGGLTNENVGDVCIAPITKYLDQAAASWLSDKTLVLPLTLNDKTFTVKYMPEKQQSINVAKQLCIERAGEIGGLTEENVVDKCINPVTGSLQKAVEDWIKSKTLVVPVTIDGKVFNLSYMPLRHTSVSMAKKLCIDNASEIGGLTNENVVDLCIKPVVDILDVAGKKWLAERE